MLPALRAASALCLLVLAVAVASGVLARVTGGELAVVTGGSMEPAIPLGAAVLIRPVAAYRPGDIVTYTGSNGTLTTHRVVSVQGASASGDVRLRTRGDANATPDPYAVPVRAVRGAVRAHLPKVGFLLAAPSSPRGRLLLLGIPILTLLVERGPRRAPGVPADGPARGGPGLRADRRPGRRHYRS